MHLAIFILHTIGAMAVMFVWEPKLPNHFGHASMQLRDGTYISWWPGEGAVKGVAKKSHGSASTFDTDVDREERYPEYHFELRNKFVLNEEKIKSSENKMATIHVVQHAHFPRSKNGRFVT